MNPNWFLGFLEGEGNFYINFSTRKKVVNPKPIFQIGLVEKDTLYKIKTFLESQNIKTNIYQTENPGRNLTKKVKHPRPQWLLQIGELQSIQNLIKILNELEWNSEKFNGFQAWKTALTLAYPRPCTKDRLIKIAEITPNISSKHSGLRKWTPAFIEKQCTQESDGRVRII